jgi:hypothetical protein
MQAPWLDGEAITDVLAMSGVVDRYGCFAVEGERLMTGMVAVADAWACTNPPPPPAQRHEYSQRERLSTCQSHEYPQRERLCWQAVPFDPDLFPRRHGGHLRSHASPGHLSTTSH